MTTFLSLVSGAIGGNFAAGLFRSLNLGLICNLIIGMLGGLAVGFVITTLKSDSPDLGSLMVATLGPATGGGAFLCIAGLVRNWLRRR